MTQPAPAPLQQRIWEDLPPAGLSYVFARHATKQPALILTASNERTEAVAADLRAFGVGEVTTFPAQLHTPYEDSSPDTDVIYQQLSVRHRIAVGERPPVIVATATALMGRWAAEEVFTQHTVLWVVGEEVDRESLSEHLLRLGYNRVNLVEDEGTFAIRGGVVDIFPAGARYPVRMDLFGDEITSIKPFDALSQRTFQGLESLAVHPIRDVIFTEQSKQHAQEKARHLADEQVIPSLRLREMLDDIDSEHYFYGIERIWPIFYASTDAILNTLATPQVRVWIDEQEAVDDVLQSYWSKAQQAHTKSLNNQQLTVPMAELLVAPDQLQEHLDPEVISKKLNLEAAEEESNALQPLNQLAAEMKLRREHAGLGEPLEPFVLKLKTWLEQRYEVFIAAASRGNAERIQELLRGRRIDLPLQQDFPNAATYGEARRHPRRHIVNRGLSGGFVDPKNRVVIVTEVEIFGVSTRNKRRRRKQAPTSEGLTTLRNLSEGDLVIHVDHGVGRYRGLQRLVLNGVDGDYAHLEYQGGDKLYLPIYRLNLLQQYRGPAEAKLDKLGGTRWEKAKQKVRDAVIGVAHELLALQARRKSRPGFALPPPGDAFRAFEATFPFEETPDQARAIEETLNDLTKDTPMDRLICGDVGFGKTEVAIRAAYLTLLAGKQVAVLVPTTVLAEQHGQRFRERLAQDAVNIQVFSRFRSAKESKRIVEGLKKGTVDVVIGTHKLLSPEVHFKDLGLLVVDEEQRFGVKHKERIKQFRSDVHVLTLSATPIPRTLNMATMGLRDLSIIQTPPTQRTAIRTEVCRFDEEVVAEAITRELHRGGQVFFVHNRIQSIAGIEEMLKEWVPQARVVVAHGQMPGENLERIMVEFVQRRFDVLLCTAIIESGIDIPTVNTMLVNRADTFGLSQLYQLRGRIGRGSERAYAYLLLPRAERITREASERLAVLKRNSDLGAGFQIASHDLDLRGAGDLLGTDQSGHIAAVGFELFTELLAEAVEQARGETHRHEVEPDIKLPVAAVLPEDYVPEPMARLSFYQRMSQAQTDEAIFDVRSEIEELYGPSPEELKNLVEVMVIRRRLKRLGCHALSASYTEGAIRIGANFVPDAPLDRAALALKLQQDSQRYRLLPSGRLAITRPQADEPDPGAFLKAVRHELGELPTTGVGQHP